MDYLIKNGRIADKNGCYEADLIIKNGKITYIPIYYIMFFNADSSNKNMQF